MMLKGERLTLKWCTAMTCYITPQILISQSQFNLLGSVHLTERFHEPCSDRKFQKISENTNTHCRHGHGHAHTDTHTHTRPVTHHLSPSLLKSDHLFPNVGLSAVNRFPYSHWHFLTRAQGLKDCPTSTSRYHHSMCVWVFSSIPVGMCWLHWLLSTQQGGGGGGLWACRTWAWYFPHTWHRKYNCTAEMFQAPRLQFVGLFLRFAGGRLTVLHQSRCCSGASVVLLTQTVKKCERGGDVFTLCIWLLWSRGC